MAIDKILKKAITINASTSEVWNILTNAAYIKEWLFGTKVISDWAEGASILFTGNWQGIDYVDKGTILRFDTEKVFEYNYWSKFSGLPDSPENYSMILFELEAKDSKTILKLTHSNFSTETMYEHSDKNWDAALDIIKKMNYK